MSWLSMQCVSLYDLCFSYDIPFIDHLNLSDIPYGILTIFLLYLLFKDKGDHESLKEKMARRSTVKETTSQEWAKGLYIGGKVTRRDPHCLYFRAYLEDGTFRCVESICPPSRASIIKWKFLVVENKSPSFRTYIRGVYSWRWRERAA